MMPELMEPLCSGQEGDKAINTGGQPGSARAALPAGGLFCPCPFLLKALPTSGGAPGDVPPPPLELGTGPSFGERRENERWPWASYTRTLNHLPWCSWGAPAPPFVTHGAALFSSLFFFFTGAVDKQHPSLHTRQIFVPPLFKTLLKIPPAEFPGLHGNPLAAVGLQNTSPGFPKAGGEPRSRIPGGSPGTPACPSLRRDENPNSGSLPSSQGSRKAAAIKASTISSGGCSTQEGHKDKTPIKRRIPRKTRSKLSTETQPGKLGWTRSILHVMRSNSSAF